MTHLPVVSKWINLIQRSVTFWPRGCARQMFFSPWTYSVIKEFPMFKFSPSCSGLSGPRGRVMMSWSGGGRGENGWWRILMFVRSLHHFLLSETLASFLIQWEQRIANLSGEGWKTAPHLLISCSGLLNRVWRSTVASSFPLLPIWASSPVMCSCKQQLRNRDNDYSCRRQKLSKWDIFCSLNLDNLGH